MHYNQSIETLAISLTSEMWSCMGEICWQSFGQYFTWIPLRSKNPNCFSTIQVPGFSFSTVVQLIIEARIACITQMLNWTEPCSDVTSEHLLDLRTDCFGILNLFYEVAKFQKPNESQISTLSVCLPRRVFSIAALKYLCPIYEANRDDGSQLQLGVLWKGLFKQCYIVFVFIWLCLSLLTYSNLHVLCRVVLIFYGENTGMWSNIRLPEQRKSFSHIPLFHSSLWICTHLKPFASPSATLWLTSMGASIKPVKMEGKGKRMPGNTS